MDANWYIILYFFEYNILKSSFGSLQSPASLRYTYVDGNVATVSRTCQLWHVLVTGPMCHRPSLKFISGLLVRNLWFCLLSRTHRHGLIRNCKLALYHHSVQRTHFLLFPSSFQLANILEDIHERPGTARMECTGAKFRLYMVSCVRTDCEGQLQI